MSAEDDWRAQHGDAAQILDFLMGEGAFAGQQEEPDKFFLTLRGYFQTRGMLTEKQTDAVRKRMNRFLQKRAEASSPPETA